MSIKIVPKEEQADGGFNAGEILEKKPIGFPQDGGKQRPYSNLFYWAHAWSDQGSTIGEHPHRGFEILSFVLKGDIEHYDSQLKDWKKLKAGDVQIIRAGNGITHAEKLNAGSAIFQVWLDPDLNKTLQKPASYNDYAADSFPVVSENGMKIKKYTGDGAPLKMDTEGIVIKEFHFKDGQHTINIDPEKIVSGFLIKGTLEINGQKIQQEDFAIIRDEKEMTVNSKGDSQFFVIESPGKPAYKTYTQMQGW